MSVEYLPHTADVRMKIHEDSPQSLFLAGLEGMNNILKPGFCQKKEPWTSFRELHTFSIDYTCLLVDFLSDVLTLSHTEKVIFCEVRILEFSELEIFAELYGVHVDSFDEDIKAVTYHEVNVVQREDESWETVVVFDI